jgi:hypothetical protein
VIFYGAILDGDGERCDRESGRAFRLWGTRGFEGRVGHEWFDDRVADERVPLRVPIKESFSSVLRPRIRTGEDGSILYRLQDEGGSFKDTRDSKPYKVKT